MAEYTSIREWAESIQRTLTAYEFNTAQKVMVEHEDGSRFWFASAFWRDCPFDPKWFGVFSEHNGWMVFHRDEACMVSEDVMELAAMAPAPPEWWNEKLPYGKNSVEHEVRWCYEWARALIKQRSRM